MVLRKSEYRKNFKWISTEKRHALWLENTLYRHDRRLREFCHQPLGWDSDPDDVPDSESENCGLPPTKLRQRRLQLLELTGQQHQQQQHTPPIVQRRQRQADERTSATSSRTSSDRARSPQEVCTRDSATQTDWNRGCELGSQVTAQGKEIPQSGRHRGRHKSVRHGTNSAAQREEVQIHCPSYGPFENYGWADEVDTVSAKRTFNVTASTTEIYPSALMAARLRHRSPTPPPKRKTFRPQRPRSAPPKEHHHVWISEYRDQYR